MAVTAEVEDRVGWITLDRPPDNRFDVAVLEELDRCVGEVAEAGVAVAVIRSASDKFFSAGADVTLGLLPSAGGAHRLSRLVGLGRALDLVATGRTVTPAEAERIGMVDRLVRRPSSTRPWPSCPPAWPPAPPWPWPPSPGWSTTGSSAPWPTPSTATWRSWPTCSPPKDAREGMTAFTEQRPPSFNGR